MNETLWIAFALIDLVLVVAVFRFFGRVGLYGLIVFNLIVCNIQVLKTVELFGMVTTLGNVLYASVFLSTDILTEFYGKAEARRGVLLGFVILIMTTAYMQIALRFIPAADDFVQPHFEAIFGFFPRIALASLAAYLLSQLSDVWIFDRLKQKFEGRHLWLRNCASTLASQLLDTVVFCTIAFAGVFELPLFVEISLTTFLIKALMAIMDTPFIYVARWFAPKAERMDAQPTPTA